MPAQRSGERAPRRGRSARRLKRSTALVAVACLGLTGCGGSGDQYPSRSVQLYVPASPGGGTDTAARTIARYVEEDFDINVAVINETGGGGALAVNDVAQSGPDGHTLLFFHEAMIVGHAEGSVRQSALDFTPLGAPVRQHQYLMAPADAGWENLDDFVEAAQQDPGGYDVAINYGETSHYISQMLSSAAEIELRELDSGSEADRVNGLLGGQYDLIVASTQTAQQYEASGDMVALAAVSPERDPANDSVPTAVEQGYDVDFPLTFMLLGPEELHDGVAETWDEIFEELSSNEDYIEDLSALAEFIDYDRSEVNEHLEEMVPTINELGDQFGEDS